MSIEAMSELLGSNYSIISDGIEPVVLANNVHLAHQEDDLTNAYVEPEFSSYGSNAKSSDEVRLKATQPPKTADDYIFQFYIGSLTVVGLFAFFRMMQRSR